MTRRASRWLLAGLAVSLALNLVLLGFVGARVLAQFTQSHAAPDPAHGFSRLLGFLPPERRAELRPILRGYVHDLRAEGRGLRAAHHELQRALRADVLDAAALERALSKVRAGMDSARGATHVRLEALAAELSLAERTELAGQLHRRGRRLSHGRREDGGRHRQLSGERARRQQTVD